jgi:hypothetical protein
LLTFQVNLSSPVLSAASVDLTVNW